MSSDVTFQIPQIRIRKTAFHGGFVVLSEPGRTIGPREQAKPFLFWPGGTVRALISLHISPMSQRSFRGVVTANGRFLLWSFLNCDQGNNKTSSTNSCLASVVVKVRGVNLDKRCLPVSWSALALASRGRRRRCSPANGRRGCNKVCVSVCVFGPSGDGGV